MESKVRSHICSHLFCTVEQTHKHLHKYYNVQQNAKAVKRSKAVWLVSGLEHEVVRCSSLTAWQRVHPDSWYICKERGKDKK